VGLAANWSKLAWALPKLSHQFCTNCFGQIFKILNAHIFQVDLITCQITSKHIDDFMIRFLTTK
jgi:hypothetical protein